jgi:AraC-like DNA-binding protein/mannose-6-phosphate isomerase-like protein (cupin superfamily)
MESEQNIKGLKRGYLNNEFRLFHIKDRLLQQFELHYHDFNKIIVFISGEVTYLIEGKAYKLKPWDILFVSNHEIHKAIINSEEVYERIVIWVNSSFLDKHNYEKNDLLTCFLLASERKNNLLRLDADMLTYIKKLLTDIEEESRNELFGNALLRNSLFLQFIVSLNRFILQEKNVAVADVRYDDTVANILEYINKNLQENLAIEGISDKFYINKYYLMHKFKENTGYTIHSYILQKRLIKAGLLIKSGMSVIEVSENCGFGDYSSFIRAFKKVYGMAPRQYYKESIKESLNWKGE